MTQSTDTQIEQFWEKIKHMKFGMLTTTDPEQQLSSRPMTNQQVDAQGQLWFFTSDRSQFTQHLITHPSVNVSFSKPDDGLYVSVSGDAELVKDRAKIEEMWSPSVAAWFPDGIDDPHVALIRVRLDSAEYWDANSSKMTQLYAMAKTALTGDTAAETSEHAKINL